MRGLVMWVAAVLIAATGCATDSAKPNEDPLPGWNATSAKTSITDFVTRVTTPSTPDFVPAEERIAVLDNDGTLWPEDPVPFQLQFVLDELKRRTPNDPQLAADPMVQAALRGDLLTLLAGKGHDGLLHVLAFTHTGMTTEEFDDTVRAWLAKARHPRFDRPYDQLTYVPQLELLNYLRANGFRTYIVSGGGADFIRVFSQSTYGIPPEQVVGSTGTVQYELRDGRPTSSRRPITSSSTTRRANPQGSMNSSVGDRSSPLVTATATRRCWSTQRSTIRARA